MAKLNPFRFSTKYQDDENDLLYYGYRYLNTSTGRWLSRDPIEEDGGLNIYSFVWNDPIEAIDALGECGKCECVERVQITNIRQYQEGKLFGHKFDLVVTLKVKPAKDSGVYFAALDWSEKVTPPLDWQTNTTGFKPGDWNNMFSLFNTSPTFDPWNKRKIPDPTATYTVTITDDPADILGSPKRTLDFRITVTSPNSPNCDCENKSITRTAEQILASTRKRPTIRKFTL